MCIFARKISLFCAKFAAQMRNIAIVLAGGSGTRMGLSRPKQFLEMGGKTILEHSVDAFHSNQLIESIIIVSNPDFLTEAEAIVVRRKKQGEWAKVSAVIPGGKERSDSSVNAILKIRGERADETPSIPQRGTLVLEEREKEEAKATTDNVNLLFHDAVRPLVDQRIINDVCKALLQHEAVNVTLPVADTIIRTTTLPSAQQDETALVMADVVDRSTLQRVQTPQGFRLTTIAEAYRRAMADPQFRATDDCGVVHRYMPEVKIALVRGSEHNLKLTYPDDLPLFEFLLNSSAKNKI